MKDEINKLIDIFDKYGVEVHIEKHKDKLLYTFYGPEINEEQELLFQFKLYNNCSGIFNYNITYYYRFDTFNELLEILESGIELDKIKSFKHWDDILTELYLI